VWQFAQFATIKTPTNIAITGEDHWLIRQLTIFKTLRFSARREVRLSYNMSLQLVLKSIISITKYSRQYLHFSLKS